MYIEFYLFLSQYWALPKNEDLHLKWPRTCSGWACVREWGSRTRTQLPHFITLRNYFNRLPDYAPITHTRSYRLRLKSTTFTTTIFFFSLNVRVLVCVCLSVWVSVCLCVGVSLNIRFCFAKFPNGSEFVFLYLNHI